MPATLKIVLTACFQFCLLCVLNAQSIQPTTYCNPLNLDYTYMIYNAHNDISYRSGADPAVVKFRNEYYMFVTRSLGYWHSVDLLNWTFISPERWYFQGSNAPAAHNYKDSVLYVTGDPSGSMSILYTDNPKNYPAEQQERADTQSTSSRWPWPPVTTRRKGSGSARTARRSGHT